MDTRQKIIIIWIVFLVSVVIIIPIAIKKAINKKEYGTEKLNEIKIEKKYNFYINNFLTRKKFWNIVKSYNSLSCMSVLQVKSQSVVLFEKALKVSLAIPLFLLVTMRDPIIALLGVLVAVVYYNVTVEKDIDSIYGIVIQEVGDLVQTISLNYMEYHNVARSVMEGERGNYLNIIVDDMYSILTDVDSERKLKDFILKSPLKILAELAEVCQITSEYGDSFSEKGESKFIEQLAIIKEEVNLEVRTLHAQRLKFNLLDKVALSGIVLMPIVDWYLLSQIPGTAILIKGVFGMAIKSVILLITIAAYYVISTINKKSVVSFTDVPEMVHAISQKKQFGKFLEKIKPKSYRSLVAVQDKLDDALSSHTIETFYIQKVLFSGVTFCLTFFLTCVFIVMARHYIYVNTGTLSFMPIVVEARTQEEIDIMDKEYMEIEPEKRPVGDELKTFVEERVRDLNMIDISDQAARLQKKSDTYENIYFKWYYIIVIYVAGFLGWFIPDLQLKLRRFLVKFEAEDDSSQLLTVMITLSGTGLSVYEVLYRLFDLATVHKSAIGFACQCYTRDPEKALADLADDSNVNEFKRMCVKLRKSIYNLPIRDAFRDTMIEKEQSLSIKEMDAINQVNKKANLANLLACTPVVIVLIFQVISPLMVLGFQQVLDMQSQLGNI